MVNGVETTSQRLFLQQPSKAKLHDEAKASSADGSRALEKGSSVAEDVKSGNYKLDTEATAKSLALYLLNKE